MYWIVQDNKQLSDFATRCIERYVTVKANTNFFVVHYFQFWPAWEPFNSRLMRQSVLLSRGQFWWINPDFWWWTKGREVRWCNERDEMWQPAYIGARGHSLRHAMLAWSDHPSGRTNAGNSLQSKVRSRPAPFVRELFGMYTDVWLNTKRPFGESRVQRVCRSRQARVFYSVKIWHAFHITTTYSWT